MPENIYVEENAVYQIDCNAALWSTDQIHHVYRASVAFLCDADFVVETDGYILLIEYKNAIIPEATHPESFDPHARNKIDNVAHKFYDSLHYLAMEGKTKPVKYVYIVEYIHAGSTDRRLLRQQIADKLPFAMQKDKPRKIIEDLDVLSIAEWNNHPEYSVFPLSPVT